MTTKIPFKSFIPYIAAIVLFLLISFAYFPEAMEGKQIGGHDNANFKGMSKELVEHYKETGDVALWSNSMFSGMPAYMTYLPNKGNKLGFLNRLTQLGPRPVSFIFLYLIGFYILLLSFRVNPWLAIIGAIAFAFSSYNFVIVAAGHNSKAIAIGYMAPIIAGIVISFRGYRVMGAILMAVALSLQLRANHVQITYYTLMIIFVLGAFQLFYTIREKQIKHLLITVSLLVFSAGVAVVTNTGKLWTAIEYGKYTMRSESELSAGEEDKTSGLTKSYATAWSYGIDETLSLLIPGIKGGSSDGSLSEKSEVYDLFARSNPSQANEVIKHLPLYWGQQSSTMGNVYVGAIVVFLFVLGMFIVDRKIKWWLLAVSILGITLAWGKNFMFLTDFFMNYLPGYNKFRTVSMTLVIPALAMPLLAILALQKIFFTKMEKKELLYALKWSAGITGGIAFLFVLFPDLAGNFASSSDGNYQPQLVEALQADRRSLVRTDALRSFLFIAAAAGVILLYRMERLKIQFAIALIGVLFIADLWPVNKRYLNSNHFSAKRVAEQPYPATPADQFILQQEGHNNRVLNLTTAIFQDASTSYHHPSLGGYHGAKLRRYQDMIDHQLMEDITRFYGSLRSQDYQVVDSSLATTNTLNMLNTKYIIINPDTQPIVNRHATGNAWFVNQIQLVENADAEMEEIAYLDIKHQAVADKKFADRLSSLTFPVDSAATIKLAEYSLDKMSYQSYAEKDQLAVFSEIYYDKGWKASIDGEEVEYLRANYMLRALPVPAGSHEIVFEFHPRSYYAGTSLSKVTSIMLLLIMIASLVYIPVKGGEKKKEDLLNT